jgi:hypothetical protein
MYKTIAIVATIFIGLLFCSCKNDTPKNNQIDSVKTVEGREKVLDTIKEKIPPKYVKQSVDDTLAAKIKNYITAGFLTKNDLKAIPENQRKFQFYKIDLNNDGKNEVFVNFLTSYFCGSGGCTLLLLDHKLAKINKFTATRTLFVEQTLQNNWRVILTESEGSWRKLVYINGSYPSNPSMVKTTDEFPGDESEILFQEGSSKLKTYTF